MNTSRNDRDEKGLSDVSVMTPSELKRIKAFRERHRTEMLAILFTDLERPKEKKQAMSDREMDRIEDVHRDILLNVLSEIPEGDWVRVEGDSYIFVFLKASDAVVFAVRCQSLHRARRANDEPELFEFRVGIHLGEIIIKPSGDIRGLEADTTARIMSLAKGGQILCSFRVADIARSGALREGRDSRETQLLWHSHGLYRFTDRGDAFDLEVVEVIGENAGSPKKPIGNAKISQVPTGDEVEGWRPGFGATLPGRDWVMEAKLGEGGFGEVWQANHISDVRRKTVFKFCTKKSRVRSLRRELEVFKRLADREGRSPPGIVEVRDHHDSEPPYYIELEYVSGGDLRQWLERNGKTAPFQVKLDIALQMLRAVHRVHEAGFVHRDIKPSNYLVVPAPDVDRSPTVKLTDFGIGQISLEAFLGGEAGSRRAGGFSLGDQTLAQAGGSFLFIAPELVVQKAGTPGHIERHAGRAADIYSLGVSLYQLFAGSPIVVPGTELAGLDDPVLREDIRACLNPKPEERPSVGDLVEKLTKHDERLEALRTIERLKLRKEKRRLRLTMAAFAFLALLVGLGFIAALSQWQHAENERALAEERLYLSAIQLVDKHVSNRRYDLAREVLETAPENYRHIEWGLLFNKTHQFSRSYGSPSDPIKAACVNRMGDKYAVAHKTGKIIVYDFTNGDVLASFEGHEDPTGLVFSPDDSILVRCGWGLACEMWDWQQNILLNRHGRGDDIDRGGKCGQFNEDSSTFVFKEGHALSRDGRASLIVATGPAWDATLTLELDHLYKDVILSPSGDILIAGTYRTESEPRPFVDEDIELLQAWCIKMDTRNEAKLLHSFKDDDLVYDFEGITYVNRVSALTFSSDGAYLFTGHHDGSVGIYDTTTWNYKTIFKAYEETKYVTVPVTHIQVSSCGEYMMTGAALRNDGQEVKIWAIAYGPEYSYALNLAEIRHDNAITEAIFVEDKNSKAPLWVVTSSEDHTAAIWSLQGERLFLLEGHDAAVSLVQVSADRNHVLTLSEDGTAKVWDLLQFEHPLAANSEREGSLLRGNLPDKGVFSSDGGFFLGWEGWDAWVWDTRDWKLIDQVDCAISIGFIHEAHITPTGTVVARGGYDRVYNRACLWSAQTCAPITEPPLIHDTYLISVSLAPKENLVVTASADGVVKVWDFSKQSLVFPPLMFGSSYESLYIPYGYRADIVLNGSFGVWGSKRKRNAEFMDVRLWDLETGDQPTMPSWWSGGRNHKYFGRRSDYLVTYDYDEVSGNGQYMFWAKQKSRPLPEDLFVEAEGLVFSEVDERFVVNIPDSPELIVIKEELKRFRLPLPVRDSELTDCAFTSDGQRLLGVSTSDQGTHLNVWDGKTGLFLTSLLIERYGIADYVRIGISPNDNAIIIMQDEEEHKDIPLKLILIPTWNSVQPAAQKGWIDRLSFLLAK